ncbi:MAG: ribosome maturation factor RimM [Clostridiales bacterium]|jgi:16S rRNA processing protein RimM|nr:ribosome maturation factor RimM [Clostridiales bacterium]
MAYITVGRVLRAQGLKGEIKAQNLSDDPARFDKLKAVYIGGRPYALTAKRAAGAFAYLSLSGVTDRDTAQSLSGKDIQIDRVNAAELADGEYFIADITGSVILTESGKILGEITDVSQFGAADVIEAKNGDKTFRFPFLKRLVLNVDTVNKRFTVDEGVFCGVCVYDD